ncbi:MAG TPA: hypothetical protein VKS23_03235 [Thermoanaerobaculia bacterium]|nr:hypothetical protein [Thermoanaerobaculia bacterium]
MESRRLRPVALVAAAALVTGCRFAWNLWARGDLARDAKSLVARQGVVVSSMRCRMFGTLRAGACIFPLSAEETSRVVQGLRLRVLTPTENIREFRGGCSQTPPFDTGFVRAFRSGAFRPAELRLRDGGGFDYVYLYQHPTSGTACLQTSYTQEGAVGTAASPITN